MAQQCEVAASEESQCVRAWVRQLPGFQGGADMIRIWKGGSWLSGARFVRASHRSGDGPRYRSDVLGFRLVIQ